MMKRIAYIFPGQGSQFAGMGKDLFETYPAVRDLYTMANDILGFDIGAVSFEGPEDLLRQTRNTQPAILLHSLAVLTVLEGEAIEPVLAAGHSLGEYSALRASGALQREDVISLVLKRARFMQQAGEENPGTMAAIIGLSREEVERICSEASMTGPVQPANFNSPGQIVVSGAVPGVHRAIELAKEAKAKKAVELTVGGAFHSVLMEPASANLTQALSEVTISGGRIPVISNVSAEPMQDPEMIRTALADQLTHPVLWEDSMGAMLSHKVDHFIEAGPGRVLRGLMRRIDRNAEVTCLGDVSSIEDFLQKRESWDS